MKYEIFHDVNTCKSSEYYFVKLIDFVPLNGTSSFNVLLFSDNNDNMVICNNPTTVQQSFYDNYFKDAIGECFVINLLRFSNTGKY